MSKKVAIMSIGDELLNGSTNDTNSTWIAKELSIYKSLVVNSKITSQDNLESIVFDLDNLIKNNHQYIFITGGLGPTHDDITKKALSLYFKSKIVLHDSYFIRLKKKIAANNIKEMSNIKTQAEILEISKPIPNKKGLAIGMMISSNKVKIFVLPGVPSEMKSMIKNEVIPSYIAPNYKKIINNITLLTTGAYESKLYDLLKETISSNLDKFKISFLPNFTGVKIRLTICNNNLTEKDLMKFKNHVTKKIDKYVYGYDKDKIEKVVADLLINQKLTIATAESCTGGYLAKKLTNYSGSSKFFKGSIVAYSNDVKKNLLNVPNSLLNKDGAVSESVALHMANEIRNKFNSDIGISTTGISGPSGGSSEKPVGLIYIAVSKNGKNIVKKFNFRTQNRATHRLVSVHTSLNILRLILEK